MTTTHVTASVSGDPVQQALGQIPAVRAIEAIGYGLFALLIFLIGFDISEPAPYDFVAAPVILLWLALGIRLARGAVFFVGLLLIHQCGLILAFIPHLDYPPSVVFTAASFYLTVTAIFFVMFFSEHTQRRVELAFNAFLASCLVAAVLGIAGYFDVMGTGPALSRMGRASGAFNDPNVFGSFLILGLLFVVRDLLAGEARRPLLALAALPILLAGVLLSFSRGSWAATFLALAILLGVTFATSPSMAVRRRIVFLTLVTVVVCVVSIAGLLAMDEVRGMFEERAHVVHDYDSGETGRFGNQLRAIPMLMERPNGFGPLRYRAWFEIEPHNSYIGAFANGGWIGGFAFIGIMLTTAFVSLRLSVQPSPFQRQAQILMAAHVTLVLQSFQIDIDHWRHVYLVWGMIWGLHVARLRWLAAQYRGFLPPPFQT